MSGKGKSKTGNKSAPPSTPFSGTSASTTSNSTPIAVTSSAASSTVGTLPTNTVTNNTTIIQTATPSSIQSAATPLASVASSIQSAATPLTSVESSDTSDTHFTIGLPADTEHQPPSSIAAIHQAALALNQEARAAIAARGYDTRYSDATFWAADDVEPSIEETRQFIVSNTHRAHFPPRPHLLSAEQQVHLIEQQLDRLQDSKSCLTMNNLAFSEIERGTESTIVRDTYIASITSIDKELVYFRQQLLNLQPYLPQPQSSVPTELHPDTMEVMPPQATATTRRYQIPLTYLNTIDKWDRATTTFPTFSAWLEFFISKISALQGVEADYPQYIMHCFKDPLVAQQYFTSCTTPSTDPTKPPKYLPWINRDNPRTPGTCVAYLLRTFALAADGHENINNFQLEKLKACYNGPCGQNVELFKQQFILRARLGEYDLLTNEIHWVYHFLYCLNSHQRDFIMEALEHDTHQFYMRTPHLTPPEWTLEQVYALCTSQEMVSHHHIPQQRTHTQQRSSTTAHGSNTPKGSNTTSTSSSSSNPPQKLRQSEIAMLQRERCTRHGFGTTVNHIQDACHSDPTSLWHTNYHALLERVGFGLAGPPPGRPVSQQQPAAASTAAASSSQPRRAQFSSHQ